MDGLYDDLEVAPLALQLRDAADALMAADRTREELRALLDASAAREQGLREQNTTLARNISALFATAKREVRRGGARGANAHRLSPARSAPPPRAEARAQRRQARAAAPRARA